MTTTQEKTEYVCGIKCIVKRERCFDGIRRDAYTFTVPGWEECTVVGIRAARRTINGRLDAAVRNTMGMD